MLDLILKVILPLVGAYWGVVLGFNKYKNEKNWDKKVKVYTEIMILVEKIAFSTTANHYSLYRTVPLGFTSFNSKTDLEEPIRQLTHLEKASEIFLSHKFAEELSNFLAEAQDLYSKLQDEDTGDRSGYDFNDEAFIGKIGGLAYDLIDVLNKEAKKDIIGNGTIRQKLASYIGKKITKKD